MVRHMSGNANYQDLALPRLNTKGLITPRSNCSSGLSDELT
jgi:hypothetical protein